MSGIGAYDKCFLSETVEQRLTALDIGLGHRRR